MRVRLLVARKWGGGRQQICVFVEIVHAVTSACVISGPALSKSLSTTVRLTSFGDGLKFFLGTIQLLARITAVTARLLAPHITVINIIIIIIITMLPAVWKMTQNHRNIQTFFE